MSPLEKARLVKSNRQALKAKAVAPIIRQIVAFTTADSFSLTDPESSVLVRRAMWLAQKNAATLHLVHIMKGFGTRCEQAETDKYATKLAEAVTRLASRPVSISTNVISAPDRVAAQIGCAESLNADLIVKEYEERAFYVGLKTHEDWDLLRHSPIPVWFIKSDRGVDTESEATVVAAVGSAEQQGKFQPNDFSVAAYAHKFSEDAGSDLRCIHHYRADAAPPSAITLAPFRKHVGIPARQFLFQEGRPQRRLPELTEQSDAQLLVMATQPKSYWGRLFSDVESEPVLAASTVDVLFIPDLTLSPEPASDAVDGEIEGQALVGAKDIEFVQALNNPSAYFSSPSEVIDLEFTSDWMKRKLLASWLQKTELLQQDLDKGGQHHVYVTELLVTLNKAINRLNTDDDQKIAA